MTPNRPQKDPPKFIWAGCYLFICLRFIRLTRFTLAPNWPKFSKVPQIIGKSLYFGVKNRKFAQIGQNRPKLGPRGPVLRNFRANFGFSRFAPNLPKFSNVPQNHREIPILWGQKSQICQHWPKSAKSAKLAYVAWLREFCH